MKERLIAHEFRGRSEALLIIVEQIVSAYQDAGLRLTLRQLYYQLVSRNIIPNVERAYKNLSTLVSTARLAGRIDWDAIEDRTRVPVIPPEFSGLDDLVGAALQSYRLPRWEGQDHYVELWVEKDALAGILRPLAHADHVVLMVNRGYSSQSAMYEAANRFLDKAGQNCVLLYLGDLDPSGEDMVRDIQERFDTFGVDVAVHKVALTMEQVRQFNPPPNPAKHTDPRARGFIARHGATSWEVDALPPEALDRIIRRAVEAVVDRQKMQAVIEQEEKDRVVLREAVKNIPK